MDAFTWTYRIMHDITDYRFRTQIIGQFNELVELGILNLELIDTLIICTSQGQKACFTRQFNPTISIYNNIKLLADNCEKLYIYPNFVDGTLWTQWQMKMDAEPGWYGGVRCVQYNPK